MRRVIHHTPPSRIYISARLFMIVFIALGPNAAANRPFSDPAPAARAFLLNQRVDEVVHTLAFVLYGAQGAKVNEPWDHHHSHMPRHAPLLTALIVGQLIISLFPVFRYSTRRADEARGLWRDFG
jgi:hypothetical protein